MSAEDGKTWPGSISIFGIGYVGSVLAGCLAAGGHKIIAVGRDQER